MKLKQPIRLLNAHNIKAARWIDLRTKESQVRTFRAFKKACRAIADLNSTQHSTSVKTNTNI